MARGPGGEIIDYEAPGAEVRVDVRLERETVWLTLGQIAERNRDHSRRRRVVCGAGPRALGNAMTGFTESFVEDGAVGWLEARGYAVLHGADIAPDKLLLKDTGRAREVVG
jgi:hypothetical protein